MKFLVLGICLHLFSLLTFAQNFVTASISVPEQIEEGQSVTEVITINKPAKLHSYATFHQVVPNGFFIETKNVNDASINFQNNILTINWMRLPSKKSLKIPIKLSYIKGMKGTFSLSGKFTYLVSGEKGEYKIPPQYFTITNSEKIIQNNYSVNINPNQYNISCVALIKKKSEKTFDITVTIKNLPKQKTFILTQEINDEFEFIQEETKNYKKINNRIIQFDIATQNGKNELLLTYSIKCKLNNPNLKPVIFGKLSFIDKNQIVNIPVRIENR